MRQVFTVAWFQFRLTLKNKGYLAIMFLMPLVITAIYALTTGESGPKPTPIAVVDADGSPAARALIAALQANNLLAPRIVAADQVDLLLANHEVEAGLIIPKGYGAKPDLQLVTPPGSTSALVFRPIILGTANAVIAGLPLKDATPPAAVNPVSVRSLQERAAGFSLMFVVMALLLMGGTILQERKNGTLGRILSAPAARAEVLGGYFLSFVLTGLFQCAVLVATSTLLFHIHWGPVLPLAVTGLAIVLAAAGLGLLLSSLVKSAEQQTLIGTMVAIMTAMLGGVYWPVDTMDSTMQMINHLNPVAWAMKGLQEVMLRGANWSALLLPLTLLLATALITTSVGVIRQRWE